MSHGFSLRDDRWSVARVAEEARARLEPPPPPPAERLDPRIPSQPSREGYTYIYVLKSQSLVKIGYADNPYLRFSTIRGGNPFGVEPVLHVEIAKARGKLIEKLVHDIFADSREGGEWFAISPERAVAAIEKLIALASEL